MACHSYLYVAFIIHSWFYFLFSVIFTNVCTKYVVVLKFLMLLDYEQFNYF